MFDERPFRSEMAKLQSHNGTDPQPGGSGGTNEVIVGNKSTGVDAGDNRLTDIQTHATRLMDLLNELRSITHRACDLALREADCVDRIQESMETDITGLQCQLKEKDESLQAREITLAKLEETSTAKFAELESRIRDKETQLHNRESQLEHLTSERDYLIARLNEAELSAKQAQSQAHQFTQRLEELSELRLQLAKHEESLAARESALNQLEGDLMVNIQNLQLRLQETEAKLATRERELQEKESVIQAAGLREMEIGKLIQRLSSECEKLSAELHEKTLLIARLEDKTRHSTNSGKVWNRILG